MIDEIALADPAREATPTAPEAARMDDELRRMVAAETLVGAAGDARVAAAGDAVQRGGGVRGGRRRRRRAWVLAPAALATAALTLVALPGGKTTAVLEPAPASAATVLTDLGEKAAGAPTERGRYAYLKQISYTTHMRPNDETVVLPHEYEQWVADDGTGVMKQVIHWDEGHAPPPPFDEDAPRAMKDIDVLGLSLEEVKALPTDPAQLKAKLADRDNVIVTAYAGALLSFAGTPQDVKVALFSVLKSLPDAELIPTVTDPLERTGVGVQFDDEAWRTLFLFDPDTGALLGTKSIGKKEVPGRTIEDWNLTVKSGWTDTAPKTAR